MAACPNCGRRTLRTKDWVCQWCGYPLLYGGYKQIDKTYKELQEERNSSWKSVKPEPEPEFDFEAEPELPPEPRQQSKRPPEPAYKLEPEPEPKPEPAPQPGPRLEPQPAPSPVAQPRPETILRPESELAPPPRPEQLPRSSPGPVPLPEAEIAPEPEAAPQPEPQPMITPPPQPIAPPRQEIPEEPLIVPSLDSIKEGTELTIDQIDALFKADSVGANTALKEKTVIIKGLVNKVFIRDHLDIRYMILTGTRRGIWTVRCQFGKESSPQISRLAEGQAVALRGRYDGFSKNIIFKDCTLVTST